MFSRRARTDATTKQSLILTLHPVDDVRVRHREFASLRAAGIEVVLLGANPKLGVSAGQGVRIVAIGDPMASLRARAGFHLRLARALLRRRPSIVHLHEPETLWIGAIGRAIGASVLYDVHEYHELLYSRRVPEYARPAFERIFVAIERLLAKAIASHVVTVTPQLVERFASVVGVTAVENFASKDMARDQPQRYDDWSARSDVVAIGSLGVARGTHLMLDALSLAVDRRPGLRVTIVGRCSRHYPEEQFLADLESRGLRENTQVVPNLPPQALAALLGGAAVGLSVTRPGRDADGAYPTKLFEYMAQQVAIVTTASVNSAGIVRDAGCGIVVDFSPTSIAEAIVQLTDNRDEAYRLATAGLRSFRQELSWEGGPGPRLVAAYEAIA